MKSQNKYIRKETKGQIIFIVLIILAVLIGLLWNALEREPEYNWEPATSFPIANAQISWEQTFHGGAWNE